tara:strand:+ start:834 stop:1745 length:912 start_codon:yes stop_codon:yes gene_type:complete
MRRREFIKIGGLGAVASGVIPTVLLAGRDCDLTTDDILGPYWDENHPYRTILAHADEPGERIYISGTVKTNGCHNPISNAIIDVWHANDDGCYTLFQECEIGNPTEDPYNLRGQMVTNQSGEYAFETIWPGYYADRPRHFHYKVTTPEGLELITQCYFESDPEIDDQFIETHPGLIIPLENSESGLYGTFNIVMDEDGPQVGIDDPKTIVPSKPFLKNNYPNPFNNTTNFEFGIFKKGHVSIAIYNVQGQWVTNLVDDVLSPGIQTLEWRGKDSFGNQVASGNYLLVMKSATFTISNKIVLVK